MATSAVKNGLTRIETITRAKNLLLAILIVLLAVENLVAQGRTPPNTNLRQVQSNQPGLQAAIPLVNGQPIPQIPPTGVPNPAPTLESVVQTINARMEQVSKDTEAPAETRDALLKLYQPALADLKIANEAQKARLQYAVRIAAAPTVLADAKARRDQPVPQRNMLSDNLEYSSFDDVQKELQELQAQLTTVTDTRAKLTEQIANRDKRRKDLPQLISDARSKLEAIGPPTANNTDNVDPLMIEAVEWQQFAMRAAASELSQSLEAEQRAYEAESELLPLQLEIAQASEKRLQDLVRKVTDELNRMRQDRILTQENEAQKILELLPSSEKQAGQALVDRTHQWSQIARKRAELKAGLSEAKALFDHWKDLYAKMESRVNGQDVAGFNSWVGLILRKQRSELPDTMSLRSDVRGYQREVQAAETALFNLEDELPSLVSQVDRILESRPAPNKAQPTPNERLTIKSKEVVSAMKVDLDEYLNDLYQAADLKEQTLTLSDKYRAFIDEHVLWIRSSEQLERSDWKPAMEAFNWLVSLENWKNLGQLLLRDMVTEPWWWILFTVVWLALLFNQPRLRRGIGSLGEKVIKKTSTKFRFTAETALLTILIALPLPALFLFLYWRLINSGTTEYTFTYAIAQGCLLSVTAFLPLELVRQASRADGLGIKHFDWLETSARTLRGNLRWLIDFSLPFTAIVGICSYQTYARWEGSLGRVAFIVVMVLLMLFFSRVFVPRSGILSRFLNAHRDGWLDRLRYLWYAILIISPLIVASLAFIGYYYTAQRIALHMTSTLWVIVGLTLTYYLLRRWLLLSRRKLMIAHARQRLAEAARREPNQIVAPVTEENEVNLVAINEQTMRLVSSFIVVTGLVAIYFIWSDVLPAMAVLEHFTVWTVKGDLPDETVSITLKNLVLVIPIIALIVIAARNLPGLLEIALLQHLPITNAARYAISTLSRYAILFVGIFAASSTIGLRWASIQWLVAALGVGLGFGLQEIFANFVSGIILLFEQPIRVGDVITLDGTTGTVSRIRMRATTVANFDGQELIIPNKDLITGKLLNWTLSDTNNRIVFTVGVAYGSDPNKACVLIQDLCERHPNILSNPPPIVTFDSFGDNALNVTVRFFLTSLELRLPTIHELHLQIYKVLNDTGIEISFPQRDLHLRTLPTELTAWLKSNTATAGTAATAMAAGKYEEIKKG